MKDFRVPVNRIERMESMDGDAEPVNKGYGFLRLGNEEEAKQLLDALNEAKENGFNFPGAERPPLFRYATPQKPQGDRQFGNRRDGNNRVGFNSFGGGDRGGDRRGGNRFGGGDRQQRRPSNNSWLNEEKSRFQGGRGDEY